MKSVLVAMIFLMVGISASATSQLEYAEVDVDWSPDSLEQAVTMMCDDTYYSGITLTVVGNYPKDFSIHMDAPIDWKIYSKKNVIYKGQPATQIKIKGGSDSATLKIFQRGLQNDLKKAVIEIADAC